jgi:hypothetical protein
MKTLPLLLLAALLFAACATRPTRTSTADRTWEHLGLPNGPDTSRKVDAQGNPNFGPR